MVDWITIDGFALLLSGIFGFFTLVTAVLYWFFKVVFGRD